MQICLSVNLFVPLYILRTVIYFTIKVAHDMKVYYKTEQRLLVRRLVLSSPLQLSKEVFCPFLTVKVSKIL